MRQRKTDADRALRLVAREQIDTFEKRFGCFGGVEIRGGTTGAGLRSDLPLNVEMRTDGAGRMMVKGHASVFNRLSLELGDMFGSFKEKVADGAFDRVLDSDPHVTLNYLHDDGMILSSTRAIDPLELRVDPVGLAFFARVIRDEQTGELPSYANDLRIAMQNNVVRQASFKFIVGRDEWHIDENENVTRTILEVEELFDVCVCPMGAYPQTDAQLLRKRATDFARKNGKLGARADVESIGLLADMYELGQEFIEDEVDPEDAADRDAMVAILDQLEALIEAEAAEDAEPATVSNSRRRTRRGITPVAAPGKADGLTSSRIAGENDEPDDVDVEDADERLRLARVSVHATIGDQR